IEDETDMTQAESYEIIDKHTIVSSGDIRISKINDIMNTSIPEDANHVTLNGILHKKLNDIPKAGDSIKVNDVTINVEKVTNNKAVRLRVSKHQAGAK
ncbi:MAG: hemolysin, partial [Cenarchaeum sp. SB0669_bin_11]|nr:hemolysin [Cenarchaeum sp. SB0669_bin_11]